ncbi:MAG: hypothetical protein AAB526_01410 [Patescibacteria group bacterium]
MLNLDDLKNFENPENFKKIEEIVQEIIAKKQIREALKCIIFLEEKIPSQQKELYLFLLIKLKLLTLSLFSELEILDFFKKNLKEILKIPSINILEGIKSKIIGLPILERNGFKKELFFVLKEAVKKEKIDSKELIFLVDYLKISSEKEPEEEILIRDEEVNSEQKEMWETIKAKKQERKEEINQSQQDEPIKNIKHFNFESSKPKTESVKFIHKLVGPIEELKSITLNEFRKLGKTPEEATQIINEKINILGSDSLIKKAEGIKAWQNTEINKLYLEIGRSSLEKNISILEEIKERINKNMPTLTINEFETVTDLNKRLRF